MNNLRNTGKMQLAVGPRQLSIICALLFTLLIYSCNKGVADLLDGSSDDFGADTTGINEGTPRLLYIIVDGCRGEALRDIDPPVLAGVGRSAVYTFNALNNTSGINAVGWTDMLTGVDSSLHKVKSDDFAGNHLTEYPTIFTRIKEVKPQLKTAAFVRSSAMKEKLLQDATLSVVLSSDQGVVDAAAKELKSSDPSLVMVELNAVDSVGKANSYAATDQAYSQAVYRADDQIGQLISAVQQRENFKNEKWLIVIASNKGGPLPQDPAADTTYYNNPRGNGFVYFYNPRFQLQFYPKPDGIPYSGATPIYYNTGFYAQTGDEDAYQIKANTEMTISFKVKIFQFGNDGYNPGMVKKTSSSANSKAGWWFIHSHNTGTIRFVLHQSSNKEIYSTTTLGLNQWYSIIGKVYFDTDNKRYMKLFIDGVQQGDPLDVTNIDCTNEQPLDIGQRGSFVSGETKEMVTDLKIYDTALPDYVIAEKACKIGLSETDPYYENVIGYWPCTDGDGTVLKDLSPGGHDMQFVSSPSGGLWNPFSDISNSICPDVSDSYLTLNPKSLDIPYQIYQWLGIQISSGWGLTGKSWPASLILKEH